MVVVSTRVPCAIYARALSLIWPSAHRRIRHEIRGTRTKTHKLTRGTDMEERNQNCGAPCHGQTSRILCQKCRGHQRRRRKRCQGCRRHSTSPSASPGWPCPMRQGSTLAGLPMRIGSGQTEAPRLSDRATTDVRQGHCHRLCMAVPLLTHHLQHRKSSRCQCVKDESYKA